MKYFGTMKNSDGILSIGGVSVKQLKEEYKTPLYIYDIEHIEANIKKYLEGFKSEKFKTEIVYASKAFLSKGICQIINKYGLHIDAVTEGELYTILNSEMHPSKIHMHGNNKSLKELEICVKNEIGSILIDNIGEAEKLGELCRRLGKGIKVALRINIGIDAHTHEYIKTAKHSSKFGESIFDDSAINCVKRILEYKELEFIGFHCHIGSQIFDTDAFLEEIRVMVKYTKEISEKLNIEIPEINLGGGFGVYYTEEDVEIDIASFTRRMIEEIEKTLEEEKLTIEKVSIEPGRSLVANAGSTLYTVGGEKSTFSGEKYIFIDGGMGDNMRPALYQAKYEAVVANKLNELENDIVNIAGKCCESGDVIIKQIKIAQAKEGDLLLVPTTGAYGYSMSNNYNKLVRPAVVFVKNGKSYISIKRESNEDLIRNDIKLDL